MAISLLRRTRSVVALGTLLIVTSTTARAQTYDLTTVDGGFVATTPVNTNPWSWTAGSGWSVNNISVVGHSRLLTPVLSLAGGGFTLTLRHAYSFENAFDGAVVQASIDGGAFQPLSPTGGTLYAGFLRTAAQESANPLGGLPAFFGPASGSVTSTFDGTLAAGQSIQFAFDASWDASVAREDPAWRLEGVAIAATGGGAGSLVPEPGSWALLATGLAGIAIGGRRRRA